MTVDKVIERIRKLLALSRSANQHEAAAAAARAADLMREYQLDEARLDVTEDRPAEPLADTVLGVGRRSVGWKFRLACGLAESLGGRAYQQSGIGGGVVVFGAPSVAATVRYMYEYLAREIDRLADEAWRDLDPEDRSPFMTPRRWKYSFRFGAADTINNRLLKDMQTACATNAKRVMAGDADSAALVRVHQDELRVAAAWDRKTKGWRTVSVSSGSSADGYRSGQIAGASVNLGGGARLGAAPGKLRGTRG
jgi:hypothetical protein